jgi:aspartyl protease family protein
MEAEMPGLNFFNLVVSLTLSLGVSVGVAATPDMQLNAILGKKIIVTIDDEQYTLAEGESSAQGVLVVEVQSKMAILEWNGQSFELSPSSRISTQFETRKTEAITIRRDASLHYLVNGEVNGRSAPFVVDTGATLIALSGEQASRLGLNWQNNPSGRVETAGGATKAYSLMLEKVSIGGLDVHHVEAVVIPKQTIPALLGMSFLRHFEMSESDNVLTLKKKY